MVNVKNLEALYYVVRLGTFAAAAAHLHTTQPAISGRIRQLEEELGVSVFDRTGARARLTVKGREVCAYAERILALAWELRAKIGDSARLEGVVRLGVVDNVALTWLPALMVELASRFPAIVVELFVDHSVSLKRKLHEHELDSVIVAGADRDPAVREVKLGSLPVEVLASSIISLPAGPLSPADLQDYPIISHTPGTAFHTVLAEWFAGFGVAPPRFHSCTNMATMIRLAVAGLGLCACPPQVVEKEIADGALRVVPVSPPIPGADYWVCHFKEARQLAVKAVADLAVEISSADRTFLR